MSANNLPRENQKGRYVWATVFNACGRRRMTKPMPASAPASGSVAEDRPVPPRRQPQSPSSSVGVVPPSVRGASVPAASVVPPVSRGPSWSPASVAGSRHRRCRPPRRWRPARPGSRSQARWPTSRWRSPRARGRSTAPARRAGRRQAEQGGTTIRHGPVHPARHVPARARFSARFSLIASRRAAAARKSRRRCHVRFRRCDQQHSPDSGRSGAAGGRSRFPSRVIPCTSVSTARGGELD